MFLADLHVHSNYSDGSLSVPELIDLYGKRGFGCIAITDHICERRTFLGRAAHWMNLTLTEETFQAYLNEIEAERERAWKLYKMVVLPGFELSQNSLKNHRSAHILGIGIRRFLDASGDISDLTAAIRAQGGIAVAAHPLATNKVELQTLHLWHRREELRNEFDAWEVATGCNWFSEVERSGLPMLASSDLHHPRQINSWKSIFDCERHHEAILESVRRQDVKFFFYQDSKQLASQSLLRIRLNPNEFLTS